MKGQTKYLQSINFKKSQVPDPGIMHPIIQVFSNAPQRYECRWFDFLGTILHWGI